MILVKSDQRLCCNVDWLQWTGIARIRKHESKLNYEIYCPEGYRLEIMKGTSVFRHRAILFDVFGNKVVTVLWSPYSGIHDKRLIMFEVANMWLYSDELQDIINLTMQIHPYTYLCPTRIDICLDFELTKFQRRCILNLAKSKYYIAEKEEGSEFWSGEADKKFPHCLSFGSKKSAYKWKLYNKSKELGVGTVEPDKPYIIRMWEEFSMDINRIWRLEVSITKGNALLIFDKRIELQDMLNGEFVYRLFVTMYESRFVMRINQKHTRKSNDTVVNFLNLNAAPMRTGTPERKNVRKTDEVTKVLNRLLEQLESTPMMMHEDIWEELGLTIESIVKRFHLDAYFEKIKGMPVRDWLELQFSEVGQVLVKK